MLSENAQRATLTPIVSFPRQYFLENLAIRDDNSILVTAANHQELWYVPPSSANVPVNPLLLCIFPQSAMGRMADDFCIDENAGVAYLTTHRQNTIDRVSLEPSKNSDFGRHSVVGKPFTEQLIGPTSGAWGRGPGEYGRVAYFLTDGGTKSPPPDGIVRTATVVRVELMASP
jgi:hypothetical protein